MRLIDADALLEEARELHVDDFMLVMGMTNRQPTAYDIEKVVEELEKEKFEIDNCRYDVDLNATIDMAIDKIRKGGSNKYQ